MFRPILVLDEEGQEKQGFIVIDGRHRSTIMLDRYRNAKALGKENELQASYMIYARVVDMDPFQPAVLRDLSYALNGQQETLIAVTLLDIVIDYYRTKERLGARATLKEVCAHMGIRRNRGMLGKFQKNHNLLAFLGKIPEMCKVQLKQVLASRERSCLSNLTYIPTSTNSKKLFELSVSQQIGFIEVLRLSDFFYAWCDSDFVGKSTATAFKDCYNGILENYISVRCFLDSNVEKHLDSDGALLAAFPSLSLQELRLLFSCPSLGAMELRDVLQKQLWKYLVFLIVCSPHLSALTDFKAAVKGDPSLRIGADLLETVREWRPGCVGQLVRILDDIRGGRCSLSDLSILVHGSAPVEESAILPEESPASLHSSPRVVSSGRHISRQSLHPPASSPPSTTLEESADDFEAAQEIQECALEHYSCPYRVLKSALLDVTKERKERRVQALLKTIERGMVPGGCILVRCTYLTLRFILHSLRYRGYTVVDGGPLIVFNQKEDAVECIVKAVFTEDISYNSRNKAVHREKIFTPDISTHLARSLATISAQHTCFKQICRGGVALKRNTTSTRLYDFLSDAIGGWGSDVFIFPVTKEAVELLDEKSIVHGIVRPAEAKEVRAFLRWKKDAASPLHEQDEEEEEVLQDEEEEEVLQDEEEEEVLPAHGEDQQEEEEETSTPSTVPVHEETHMSSRLTAANVSLEDLEAMLDNIAEEESQVSMEMDTTGDLPRRKKRRLTAHELNVAEAEKQAQRALRRRKGIGGE